MKWIGLICVLLGCNGIGFSNAFSYDRQIAVLDQIRQMMHYIEEMVGLQKLPLTEAIGRCALRMSDPYKAYLENIAGKMELFCGEDIALIWQKQSQDLQRLLGKKYYEGFMHCMDQTGFASASEQAKAIEHYVRQLDTTIKALKLERNEKCKLYQSMGIIGGLFICVLLF